MLGLLAVNTQAVTREGQGMHERLKLERNIQCVMEHAVGNITKIAKALGFHENGLSEC